MKFPQTPLIKVTKLAIIKFVVKFHEIIGLLERKNFLVNNKMLVKLNDSLMALLLVQDYIQKDLTEF